jgi:hypothetical protein
VVIPDGLENKDYLVGPECQVMPQSLVIQVGLVGVGGLENQDGLDIVVGLENLVGLDIVVGLESQAGLDIVVGPENLVGLECQVMLQILVIQVGQDGQVILDGLENRV